MRTTRTLAAIAAGTLLAATLAGCGGSDDKKADKPKADSSTSAATTGASDTPTGTPSAGSTAVPPEVEAFTQKLIDAMRTKKTAHMVINMGSSVTVDADVQYQAKTTAMKMRMTSGPTTLEVIIVDGAMYMQQTQGGKYTKVTKDTPGAGQLIGSFSKLGPEASVRAMQGSIKTVKKAGTETIDGDKLTKYELTVDGAAIAEQLGAGAVGADIPKSVTYFMYVDGDDLLRRAEMNLGAQKLVLKVTNWGKPVEIKAPPASRIATQ